MTSARQHTEQTLAALAEECGADMPGLAVSTVLVDGPAEAVLTAAVSIVEAEMLVVGTSGLGTLPRTLIGSTAARVIHNTDRPVVVVREPDSGPDPPVVVGVDGTAASQRAIGFAFDFAARHRCVFLIVWLAAPLGEEVLYRSVLWRALEHLRWNRWLIFAATSAAFSVAHLELPRTPLLLILCIPIGLAGMITGNLLASVAAHQVNNFLPAVALLLATTGSAPA